MGALYKHTGVGRVSNGAMSLAPDSLAPVLSDMHLVDGLLLHSGDGFKTAWSFATCLARSGCARCRGCKCYGEASSGLKPERVSRTQSFMRTGQIAFCLQSQKQDEVVARCRCASAVADVCLRRKQASTEL